MSEGDSTESVFIGKEPCPACGSRDNLGRYSDGHGHCFGCGHYEHSGTADPSTPSTRTERRMANPDLLPPGEYTALTKRKLSEDTCRHWGYFTTTHNGKPVQVATYCDATGKPVAQKVRYPDKTFAVRGDLKAAGLYGQHLWRDRGKMLVVTEGEIDALTVSHLQGNKWPVVSVPNGAQGAANAVAKSLDWLLKFDAVIFMFDNDEPGRAAAKECAELMPPGRAKIASLPLKDASDMLMAGRGDKVISAIWDAKEFRPDGILAGTDLWDDISTEEAHVCIELPPAMAKLQAMTRGLRTGELWTFTSGSGMGKTAIIREIGHHVHAQGHTLGVLMLEEPKRRTALGFMGIEANRPLHVDRSGATPEDLKRWFDATVGSGRFFLYDHFGSTGADNLMNRIRYMAKGCGCKVIILDHLSIVVSGHAQDGDERKLIDEIMTSLTTLAMECDICLIIVSHLKRPSGDKGHEDGAQTSLSQLRGSHAIAQLSHFVVGAERDQQGTNANITTLRVLKNRFTGETGVAGLLAYDLDTGRLSEAEDPALSFPDHSTGGGKADGNEDF